MVIFLGEDTHIFELNLIVLDMYMFFFFKQKTAYEIGTGDWSSDVCSSDLELKVPKVPYLEMGGSNDFLFRI